MPLAFKEVKKSSISNFETFADWQPSWENSFSSIQRVPDELIIIEAAYSIKKVGLINYYPAMKWIMNLMVDPVYRNMGVTSALIEKLFSKLNGQTGGIRYLNIPENDYALNEFLQYTGFKMLTKQYEMSLHLS